MAVNFDDKRFQNVESQEKQALQSANNMYNNMINNSDNYYNQMTTAADNYGKQQAEIQQANTDFAIEKIEQQKDEAAKSYTKEQKGAYADWQKQSNQYGVNAEQLAASGLNRTGYSESSQVNMYNTYQNRISQARDTYNKATLEYDNGIKEAQLANNAALAEIAYQALQTKLKLGLDQFQYKNELLNQRLQMQRTISNDYYNRWQDVLKQINTENALAEEKRQFDKQYALSKKAYSSSSKGSSRGATIKTSGGANNSAAITSSNGSKTSLADAIKLGAAMTTAPGNVQMKTKAGKDTMNYIKNFISGNPNNSRSLTKLDVTNIEKYIGKNAKNMSQDELNYINYYVNQYYTNPKKTMESWWF